MINNQLESLLHAIHHHNNPPWSKEMIFAYNLGLIYLEFANKYFPDKRHHGYVKKGDPRRSELFRICLKLLADTRSKLKKEQYRNYIHAQLSILKNIKAGGASELFYGPRCLLGEPAWGRWLVWNKFFDAQRKTASVDTPTTNVNYEVELLKSKATLERQIRPLNKENLIEAMDSGLLFRMVALKSLSQVFLDTCPLVRTYLDRYPATVKRFGVKLTNAPKEALDKYEQLFEMLV